MKTAMPYSDTGASPGFYMSGEGVSSSPWPPTNVSPPEEELQVEDMWPINMTEGMLGSAGNNTTGGGAVERDENLVVWELVTLATIFILTVAGNLVVLLLVLRRRKKLTRMCYFILSLCVSDLITAFLNVLPQLMWDITYRFRGGLVLCKMVKYGQLLGPYLNSYLLVMTALDRYQVICYPLSTCTWTPRRSINMIYLASVMAMASSLPQFFIFTYKETPGGVYDCWADFILPWGPKAYVTWYALSVFILPLCVLVFAYSCICRALWANIRHKQQNEHPPHWPGKRRPRLLVRLRKRATSRPTTGPQVSTCLHNPQQEDTATPLLHPTKTINTEHHTTTATTPTTTAGGCGTQQQGTTTTTTTGMRATKPRAHSTRSISRAKIKTVKLTVTVIFCYIVCSAPFIAAQLWSVWIPDVENTSFYRGAPFTILTLLASLNSVVNPWIFVAFNENLTLLLGNLCTCKSDGTSSSSSPSGCWGAFLPGHRRASHHNNTFRSSDSNRNFRLTVFTTADADPPTQQNVQCESTLVPASQKQSPLLPCSSNRLSSPCLPQSTLHPTTTTSPSTISQAPSTLSTTPSTLSHNQSPLSFHQPQSSSLPHTHSSALTHSHTPSSLSHTHLDKPLPPTSYTNSPIYCSNGHQ